MYNHKINKYIIFRWKTMNIWFKFIVLYLLPVISFFLTLGIYALLYGKAQESTFNTVYIGIFIVAFILSSFISFNIIEHCFSQKEIMSNLAFYTQVILAGLASLIQFLLLIGGIYLANAQTPI